MDPLSPQASANSVLGRRFRVHGERRISARTTLLDADDTETRSPVRVELYDVSEADGADLIRDFRTRLRAFEGLEHPDLSPVLSGGMRAGNAYTVTEPQHGVWVGDLAGEQLQERISRRQALDIADVVLGALETLHERDLVHGHISPRTLSLADDGGVNLLLLATPAPPRPDGAAFGPQDDVAAVAELLDSMVAGQGPEHDGDSPAEHDAVSAAISELVARGNDPDPQRRPADASEYRALFRQTIDSLPTSASGHVAREEPAEGEHPRDEQPRRRRTGLWAALALVIALVGAAALWALTDRSPDPVSARMPDLVGLSPSEAAEQLAQLPIVLEISYEDVRSDDVDAGLVAASAPASGDSLAEGADVRLSVAAGPLTVLVPAVVDSQEREARRALAEEGFTDVEIVQEPAEDVPAGTVTASDPQEGEHVPYDVTVVLTVVEGVTVPDLIGSTEEEAVAALAELGLEAGVEEAEDSTRPEGEVEHHSPESGSVVEEGTLVVLGVSAGPEEDEAEEEEEPAQEDEDSPTEEDQAEGQAAAPSPDQNQPDEPAQAESELPATCTAGSWSRSDVYPEGARAVYEGTEYEAVWWNFGSVPADSTDWGPWRPVASC